MYEIFDTFWILMKSGNELHSNHTQMKRSHQLVNLDEGLKSAKAPMPIQRQIQVVLQGWPREHVKQEGPTNMHSHNAKKDNSYHLTGRSL